MFTAALYTIANKCKQAKSSSADEWINKMWVTHTMGYYSAVKRNGVMIHATTWMTLENMLSKTTQTQNARTTCSIYMKCPE